MMALFRYKAVGGDGKVVTGEMEATDAPSVIAELQRAGHYPISAQPTARHADFARFTRGLGRFRHRVRAARVTVITRQLATLLEAGIPLDASLSAVGRHLPEDRLRSALRAVHSDVRDGRSLSAALSEHADIFDPVYLSTIRAGEAGGHLGAVLTGLADHRERADAFRSSVLSALTYPAILVVVTLISLFVLMSFVIPRFVPLFEDAGSALPVLTRIVFAVAAGLQSYWWAPLVLLLVGALAAKKWLSRHDNRLRFDAWILRAPLVGEIVRAVESARLARTLGALLRNGLPLLSALRLVRGVARNTAVSDMVVRCADELQAGGRFSGPLRQAAIMPDLAMDLIGIGEETGHLESMLEKAADTLEADVHRRLGQLLTVLEPALILGLGGIIAAVIIAILMAMLGLNELIV